MDDKKKSPAHEFLSYIATLFILVFLLALIMVPFASVGFFLEGYTTIGLILFGIFLVQIFIMVLYFKHIKKKQAAKEAEYRAQNITEYESSGGRLGMLQLEYDKCKKCTTLKNGFPAIFAEDEKPSLVAYGEKLEGEKVGRIADRLFADRGLIYKGILKDYYKYVRKESAGDPDVPCIKLDKIEIKNARKTVVCYFSYKDVPSFNSDIEVRYKISKDGRNFELEDD